MPQKVEGGGEKVVEETEAVVLENFFKTDKKSI